MRLVAATPPFPYGLCLILLSLATLGCAFNNRDCMPKGMLSPETTVDLSEDNARPHAWHRERELLQASLVRLKAPAEPRAPGDKQYQVLALSGGGSHGAFSAGVLNGWTASGKRPVLDIVSGVSTGALIATYAFLGSDYDNSLRELYTNISSDEVYRSRAKAAVLWSDSAASSDPLQELIKKHITAEVVSEVALAHAQGRRLYVGTTNLDTGRLVIWNMGAIANSGKPDTLALYRRIILASASVPGFFPPVSIDVTVNDRTYTELHADGGATAQVFFRASMLDLDAAHFAEGKRPLTGSRIYILVAGKAFPDPKCVKPKAIDIASTSLGALTFAQTRNDLIRIYTLALLSGMDYHVGMIPQDLTIGEDPLSFDKREMKRLYAQGFELAAADRVWRDTPPVIDASQQSIPRSGTSFLVPDEGHVSGEGR